MPCPGTNTIILKVLTGYFYFILSYFFWQIQPVSIVKPSLALLYCICRWVTKEKPVSSVSHKYKSDTSEQGFSL